MPIVAATHAISPRALPLCGVVSWIKRLALSPLLLAGHALAGTVDGVTQDIIDNNQSYQGWQVLNGGALNVTDSSTGYITAARASSVNLIGATISDRAEARGVDMQDSTLSVIDSTISGTHTAMMLNRSTGTVTASNLFGGKIGALVTAGDLTLDNSVVVASAADGVGVQNNEGTVRARDSQITGAVNGIRSFITVAGTQANTILDNTQVVGQAGAAVLVENYHLTTANLDVRNGSVLSGADGVILEIRNSSVANVNVSDSHLVGDIVSHTQFTGFEPNELDLALQRASLTGNILLQDGTVANVALGEGSRLTGDVLADGTGETHVVLASGSQLTGRLENVNSLAVNAGSAWQMVESSTLNDLSLAGGGIEFGQSAGFQTLDVGTLAGNGTFVMAGDFASGQSDLLNVTGNATGAHQLLITSTGSDPVGDARLHLVHTGGGDATFGLIGGSVDLGTWSFALKGDGTDWYLDATQATISPGTASVLALFNTAPTVWYGELSSLRSRMGELRHNPGQSGAWTRVYGGKYNVSGSNGLDYSQQQNGFSIGADAPLPVGDGQWLVGVLAGHSDSDLSLARGSSGAVKSYYAGIYSTWLDDKRGYYFDSVLKFNRFNNDSKVNLSDGSRTKGSYSNNAVGASAEFGRHIALDDGYFVEPSVQMAGVVIEGSDYSLDNGMQADGERTRSLLGKAGVTVGKRFDLGEGRFAQPYVRAAYVHEFATGNRVSVNGNRFNNDLSGSRGELGAGLSVSIADKWDVHADFQYTDGEKLSQPWGANVGVRYSW